MSTRAKPTPKPSARTARPASGLATRRVADTPAARRVADTPAARRVADTPAPRHVAISGSQSGLGLAVRQRLEAAGWSVIGIDLPGKGAEVQADLSTPEGREAAVAGVLERCDGTLQGLVANAGVDSPKFQLTVGVNFHGAVELLDGLRPALARAGRAGAVATVSHAVHISPGLRAAAAEALLAGHERRAALYAGRSPNAAYAVSKLALARWIRHHAASADWAGSGISLNGVCPGAIQTPLLEKDLADPVKGPIIRAMPQPLGATAQPQDLAGIYEFLLAPEARYLVGQMLVTDGGVEAQWRGDDWPAPWDISMPRFLFKLFGPR